MNASAAATARIVLAWVDVLPDTLKGKRDKALILLGFAGGLTASELLGLEVSDLHHQRRGLVLNLNPRKKPRRQETFLPALQADSALECCPVRALAAWLNAAGIEDGPVFRAVRKGGQPSGKRMAATGLNYALKEIAAAAGYDPKDFSSHSLRAGVAISAVQLVAGVSTKELAEELAKAMGSRSLETARRYKLAAELEGPSGPAPASSASAAAFW